MNKKQIISLVIAVALFSLTGYLSVTANRQAEENAADLMQQAQELLSGNLPGVYSASAAPDQPYVAKLRIEGSITSATGSYTGSGMDLQGALDTIDSLIYDENNVAMLLYIDSPGGEMGASDKLYYKLLDYKSATNRPIYCYFDGTACSGAYYIAMAADEICADRNCLCVNIGVYISTYNLSGLFEKYGIEEIDIKSSENKGIGLMGQPWTDEQRAIYQEIVDLYYQQFLEVVADGRGMTTDEVRTLDDGREMLASQALEAGFIDSIDRYENYESAVLEHFGEDTLLYEQTAAYSMWDELAGYFSSLVPQSEAEIVSEFAKAHQGVTVMAYAGTY